MPEFEWQSRIVGNERAALESLIPHPANPRSHPEAQKSLLRELLSQTGYLSPGVVSARSRHILDGHLRHEILQEAGKRTMDVVLVDVTPDEELLVLATFDAVGALAATDIEAGREILGELGAVPSAVLNDWLYDYYREAAVPMPVPDDATQNVATEHDLPEKSMETYLHGDARNIVLLMSGEEYESLSAGIDAIIKREGLPNQGAALLWLLDRYEGR